MIIKWQRQINLTDASGICIYVLYITVESLKSVYRHNKHSSTAHKHNTI